MLIPHLTYPKPFLFFSQAALKFMQYCCKLWTVILLILSSCNYRWTELATCPVMLSTLENGKIVRGLEGIPSEGPVLFVGYHMLLGWELAPMVARFWAERNILLRGIAHPMMFRKLRDGKLPELSSFDTFRMMGAVPVSATNFYKLFASKSHVLLYPGGMREALHRKVRFEGALYLSLHSTIQCFFYF